MLVVAAPSAQAVSTIVLVVAAPSAQQHPAVQSSSLALESLLPDARQTPGHARKHVSLFVMPVIVCVWGELCG